MANYAKSIDEKSAELLQAYNDAETEDEKRKAKKGIYQFYRKLVKRKEFVSLSATVADELYKANVEASAYINSQTPYIYALNYNYINQNIRKEALLVKKAKPTSAKTEPRKIRPALTPEARENQMIALAVDLVEQRLLDGTASSQETTHFLKLGSMKNRLEMEKLQEENRLLKARTEALQSAKRVEELYSEAIKAMRRYSGQGSDDDEY